MSLTSFLKLSEIRTEFIKQFPMPVINMTGEIRAPPITKHYSMIGTAFDYLMRFYLEKLNPNSIKGTWIAELAVASTSAEPKLFNLTNKSLTEAKNYYLDYIKSGKISEDTLRASILLAQLDPIFRANYIDENIGVVENSDIKDLSNLIGIVNPNLFKANSVCILNPDFGKASSLVGGADADFIIDNTLVDIKTTMKLEFTRDHYNQLIGYYILSKIGFVKGLSKKSIIFNLGIYYSRYGILKTIPTKFVEMNPNFNNFIKWFKNKAKNIC